MRSLTRSSTSACSAAVSGVKCEKSKRRRSGATSEPFCAACSPSTRRSAKCRRWVALWLRRMASRRAASTASVTRSPAAQRALEHLAVVDVELAGRLAAVVDSTCRTCAHSPLRAVARQSPARVVARPGRPARRRTASSRTTTPTGPDRPDLVDLAAARGQGDHLALGRRPPRSRGTSSAAAARRAPGRRPRPRPCRRRRPSGARCSLHRGVEAGLVDAVAALRRDHVGQIEREAEGVVELEHDLARDRLRRVARERLELVLEQLHAAVERLAELDLLLGVTCSITGAARGARGRSSPISVDHAVRDLVEERLARCRAASRGRWRAA